MTGDAVARAASEQPPQYLVEHVRDAMAGDPRIGELHVQVRIIGERVFLTGEVATQERHDAISEVVARVLPQHEVHNQTTVSPLPDVPKVERLT